LLPPGLALLPPGLALLPPSLALLPWTELRATIAAFLTERRVEREDWPSPGWQDNVIRQP
jgi:hypothetical protein